MTIKKAAMIFALCWLPCLSPVRSGEQAAVATPAEMQALDRAIQRELTSGDLGSQTLGDLTRLKNRLVKMNQAGAAPASAPVPSGGNVDDLSRQLQARLEEGAAGGAKAQRRLLAMFYIFLNEPEKALGQWQLMGAASPQDLTYHVVTALLHLSLGQHAQGKKALESALALVDARMPLRLSQPVFCDSVAGYRLYVPRPAREPMPGDDLLVYVEVEGADFTPVGNGGSECDLMFALKLKDDNQTTVWAEPNFGQYNPLFTGPVRDLHAALTWRIPNNLDPGRYHLFVDVVEKSTNRVGETVIAFNVQKRPTTSETRPSAAFPPGYGQPGLEDLQKAFPGAPVTPDMDTKEKQFYDLLRRDIQRQKVE